MAKLKPPPLPDQPAEEPSVTRRAVNAGLGGLASLGNLLDLPGSSVRDILSLHNPLDQWLSPFSGEDRTSGRDMLRGLGLAGKEDSWANMAGGLAVDIATDPLTYLSLGTTAALTKGGQAAKRLGLIDHATAVARAEALSKVPAAAFSAAPPPVRGLIPKVKQAITDFGSRVGPRTAQRTVTLNQLVDKAGELGLHELPAKFTGASLRPPTTAQQAVRESLDRYAVTNGFASGADFLSKHGSEPLARGAHVGLPFMAGEAVDFPHADKIAAGLDAAGALLGASLPARAVKALFHAPALGMLGGASQTLGESVYGLRKHVAQRVALWGSQARSEMDDLSKEFLTHFQGATMTAPGLGGGAQFTITSEQHAREALDTLAAWVRETSGVPDASSLTPTHVRDGIKTRLGIDLSPAAGPTAQILAQQQVADKLLDVTKKFSTAMDSVRQDLVDRGIDVGYIGSDLFSYWSRQTKKRPGLGEHGWRMFPTASAGTHARTPEIALLPRDVVSELVANPAYRKGAGRNIGAIAADIHNNFGPYLDQYYGMSGTARHTSTFSQQAASVAQHADDVAKWIQTQSKDFAGGGGQKFYPNSPVEDAISHLNSSTRVMRTADGVFHTILKEAVDEIPGGGKTVRETLQQAGYDPDTAIRFMAKSSGTDAAGKALLESTLGERWLPPDLANDLVSLTNKTTNPQSVGLVTHFWDGATNFLKENLTLVFPAFHIRNLSSGQGVNLMSGEITAPGHYREYLEALKEGHRVRLAPTAHRELLQELQAYGVFQYGFNPADIPGLFATHQMAPPPLFSLASARADVATRMADKAADVEKGLLRQHLGLDPAGRAAQATDQVQAGYETAMEFGRRAAGTAEWYNRVPMYLYLKKRGFSPEMAAQKVADLHVDYGALAPFEKSVMRRAVPFYSFVRAQLGQLGERLMERQGGLPFQTTAGTIKAIARLRNPDELVPDYVAETSSIRLPGEGPEGERNYLTGLGLAFEDPLSFFGKGLRGAGMEALSRLNPLVKGPLEYSTGEVFFQAGPSGGRDLADADPLIGRTLANVMGYQRPVHLPELVEVAASNSPLSRYLTTLRQVADPRKSLPVKVSNLGTGMRITTVSQGSSDAILRERVQTELRDIGARSFTRTYVPEEFKAEMSPDELAKAERLSGTMNTLAERAKARKKRRLELQEDLLPKTRLGSAPYGT